jgi:hypothetical protein
VKFIYVCWFILTFKFFTAEEKKRALDFFREEVDNFKEARKIRCEEFRELEGYKHPWKVYKNCVHTELLRRKKKL